MFLIIANPVIERLWLPKRFAGAAENLVRFAGRVSLPTLHNLAQRVVWHRPENGVDVIGHHDPSVEAIALAIEEAQCSRGEIADFRPSEPAFAFALVQIRLQLAEVIPRFIVVGKIKVVSRLVTENRFRRWNILSGGRAYAQQAHESSQN